MVVADDPVSDINQALSVGDLAKAYDLALSSMEAGNPSRRLRYLAVLALARMGALEQAEEAYRRLALEADRDVDTLSLRARLLKDRAFDGIASTDALLHAARAYDAVYDSTQDPFPGINAATLYCLGDLPNRARTIADQILNLDRYEAPADYYDHATCAEALLILDRRTEARQSLERAIKAPGAQPGTKATTRSQLSRLIEKTGADASVLDPLREGAVLHYTGRMFAEDAQTEASIRTVVRRHLNVLKPVAAFGSLACGSDIVIAEELLKDGVALSIVLPSSADDFIETSVTIGGTGWASRVRACLDRADDVTVTGERAHADDPASFAHAAHIAMGRALLRARNLGTDPVQIAIHDNESRPGPAGTTADRAAWLETGHSNLDIIMQDLPPVTQSIRRTEFAHRPERLSFLFCDFKGFTSLSDSDLPEFWAGVIGAAARVLATQSDAIVHQNSWGDAIFAAFTDPMAAIHTGLALQEAVEPFVRQHKGTGLRVALHSGLAFTAPDPIVTRTGVFGADVSRAARIEPITAPGAVYATEAIAALAALREPDDLQFGYLGRLSLAKGYGVERLYRVSRRTTS